jgi:hypothetical protein
MAIKNEENRVPTRFEENFDKKPTNSPPPKKEANEKEFVEEQYKDLKEVDPAKQWKKRKREMMKPKKT